VVAMREAAAGVNRYPETYRLHRKLAGRLGVEPGQLVFGTGCGEVLELVAKAFLGPGDEAVYAWPSFALYPLVVQGMGARTVPVPLDDFVHDLPGMAKAVGERTRVVIVCNPNNPTGTSVGRAELDRFVEALPADVVLVIDEAYCEYARRADFPDGLEVLARRPATLVLRTFSKIHGLAGLRLGWAYCPAEVAAVLHRVRGPFNVGLAAQAAGLAAIQDGAHVETSRRHNSQWRQWFSDEARALGLTVYPSEGNFVLMRFPKGTAQAEAATAALKAAGILVRPVAAYSLPDCLRVTIGTEEDMRATATALREFLS